jgi:hypothetical protein
LEANGYATSNKNLTIILSASRSLYVFFSSEGQVEVSDYRTEVKGHRPIKGPVVLQFDLVIQIVSTLMNYVRDHPGEAIQTAAALAYLEERLEKRMGGLGKRIWKKIWTRKLTAPPKRQIIKLAEIPKRQAKKAGTRGSSNAVRRRRKTFRQVKLD